RIDHTLPGNSLGLRFLCLTADDAHDLNWRCANGRVQERLPASARGMRCRKKTAARYALHSSFGSVRGELERNVHHRQPGAEQQYRRLWIDLIQRVMRPWVGHEIGRVIDPAIS